MSIKYFSTKPIHPIEVILGVLVLSAIPFLFLVGPQWLTTSLGNKFINLCHYPFFGSITYLFYKRLYKPSTRITLAIFFSILVLGILIEVIQSKVGRDASWEDVARNSVGSIAVLLWLSSPTLMVWAGRAVVTVTVTYQVAGFSLAAFDYLLVLKQFPLISNFENQWDVSRWKGNIEKSDQYKTEGHYSLKVKIVPARYSGIRLSDMPDNWDKYSRLHFDIYNPNKTQLELTLRIDYLKIDEDQKNRYNHELLANPGWNSFSIQLAELADIDNEAKNRDSKLKLINKIHLFSIRPTEVSYYYTDNWYLD